MAINATSLPPVLVALRRGTQAGALRALNNLIPFKATSFPLKATSFPPVLGALRRGTQAGALRAALRPGNAAERSALCRPVPATAAHPASAAQNHVLLSGVFS